MRVIGGSLKGRKLKRPLHIRPTRDFVKEALFNILGSLEGKVVYDICAGSGSLGIEALSRGAQKVVFIEKDRHNCEIIQGNLMKVDPKLYEIKNASLESFSPPSSMTQSNSTLLMDPSTPARYARTGSGRRGGGFEADIILFDPPYDEEKLYQKMFELGTKAKLLVMESSHPLAHENYILKDQRHYGSTYLSFFTLA